MSGNTRLRLVRTIGSALLIAIVGVGTFRAFAQDQMANMPGMKAAPNPEAMKAMPLLREKSTYVVTGKEDWAALRGFGKDSQMVSMMTMMMVGGSGMEHMSMGAMAKSNGGMKGMPGMAPGTSMAGMPGMSSNKTTADMSGMSGMASSGYIIKMVSSPAPAVVGSNTVTVTVTGPDGKPAAGLKLNAVVEMTSMNMGVKQTPFKPAGPGRYSAAVQLAMQGPWRVTATGQDAQGKPIRQVLTITVP